MRDCTYKFYIRSLVKKEGMSLCVDMPSCNIIESLFLGGGVSSFRQLNRFLHDLQNPQLFK